MDRNISYLSDKHVTTTTVPHFFGGMPLKAWRGIVKAINISLDIFISYNQMKHNGIY